MLLATNFLMMSSSDALSGSKWCFSVRPMFEIESDFVGLLWLCSGVTPRSDAIFARSKGLGQMLPNADHSTLYCIVSLFEVSLELFEFLWRSLLIFELLVCFWCHFAYAAMLRQGGGSSVRSSLPFASGGQWDDRDDQIECRAQITWDYCLILFCKRCGISMAFQTIWRFGCFMLIWFNKKVGGRML